MGRQTRFFMSRNDESELFDVIRERGDSFVDKKGMPVPFDEAGCSSISKLFIVGADTPELVKFENGYLHSADSSVVELKRSCTAGEKHIECGRIWAEFRYWDSNQQLVSKSKSFEEIYNYYARWIRRRCRISQDKLFYAAPDAYRKCKEEQYTMMYDGTPVDFV